MGAPGCLRSLTDERGGDDGSHSFHHKLICLPQLKSFWPKRSPPVGMILVGQIFLPSGFLPAVRGVAVRLICLLLCSQIECVHSGCVNGQKCGTGTWHAGLVKRNFSHSLLCNQNSEFIPAIMSGVLLLGRGWNLRCLCVIYKLHMWVFSSETT